MSKKDVVFVDTETTGLSYASHEVVEVGWAVGRGEIKSLVLPHLGLTASDTALEINRYYERGLDDKSKWASKSELEAFKSDLEDSTIAGANIRFDARMLERVFGHEPWHYRLFDFSSWLAGRLGWGRPRGMKETYEYLSENGYELSQPDHSAAGDVLTMQQLYYQVLEKD